MPLSSNFSKISKFVKDDLSFLIFKLIKFSPGMLKNDESSARTIGELKKSTKKFETLSSSNFKLKRKEQRLRVLLSPL